MFSIIIGVLWIMISVIEMLTYQSNKKVRTLILTVVQFLLGLMYLISGLINTII